MTLDRTGEPIDDETNRVDHRHGCRGWLGEDQDGRLIPCLICKPHLAGASHVNDCDPEIR
ncbi:hypothetical protein L1080_023355 [Rhodococcus sp. MSC1_016]|jgi:hypothetical protein|uniref:hypothetical protein n=1 Tax=Rhodococcus sp. MSC1_016 TaxID=2909266 RepID=UPI002030F2B3|nr:hypothetical protein [Rhodococcus sp. MSC1_016]